ncbi:MAG: hypothetical protein ACFFDI_01680 [Promethearchaeota archaeon]
MLSDQIHKKGLLLFQLGANLWTQTLDVFLQMYEAVYSFENLLNQIVLLILLYLLFEVIGWIFPAFRRLLNVVFLPFRMLHAYAHIFTAHYLNTQETNLLPNRRTQTFSVLSVALDREDSASVGIRPSSTRAAYKIAMAPSMVAFVLFLLFLISGQLLSANQGILLELQDGDQMILYLVSFMHLYLYFGITRAFASFEDINSVFLTYMKYSKLSPFFLAWTMIVFTVVFTTDLLTEKNAIQALSFGILAAAVYLFLYIIMITRLQDSEWVLDWADLEEAENQEGVKLTAKQVLKQLNDAQRIGLIELAHEELLEDDN